MANIFERLTNWLNPRPTGNIYNRLLFDTLGGQGAQYDYNNATYLLNGFGKNPDVFAMIMQMADKTKSVPYYVKKVDDKEAKTSLDRLELATKGNYSVQQLAKKRSLEYKAFDQKELKFPMDQPNATQTWGDIFALFKVYMKTTGNFYLYIDSVKEGNNAGKTRNVYVLPSHLVKIVLRKDANVLEDENPIDYYVLIEGNQTLTFPSEDIIHVKYPNPFFDFAGSHLYGLSPVRALLRNIESSNSALDHNVKMMKHGGMIGFIGSSDINTPLTAEMGLALKARMREMDESEGRIEKIGAYSVPLTFTKLSLNTDELKPFDFLKHDQKAIANVLGWSDKLLNNDDGAKYDNVKEERKRVITDNILPDLKLLQEAFNKHFLPRFKGYENAVIEWDITELPEMQENIKELVEWMSNAPVTFNEIRQALKYETLQIDGMDIPWVSAGKKRIDEVGISDSEIEKAFRID